MIPSTTKDTIGLLICFYKPNKNESRTDIINDDQKSYAFVLTYGYGYTTFLHHFISVVVFSYSNMLESDSGFP